MAFVDDGHCHRRAARVAGVVQRLHRQRLQPRLHLRINGSPFDLTGVALQQAVIDVLQSEGSALAGITEVTPNAMIDNFANAVNLEAEPYQAEVDGDLVFFTAARNPATS